MGPPALEVVFNKLFTIKNQHFEDSDLVSYLKTFKSQLCTYVLFTLSEKAAILQKRYLEEPAGGWAII